MRLYYTLFLMLFASSVMCQQWTLNKDKSEINFKIRNAGSNVNGAFKSFSGKLDLEGDDIEAGKISGEIQVASIETGVKRRDRHLLEEEYFYEEEFPVITFKSKEISKTDSNTLEIQGQLTIRGITKQVAFQVDYAQQTRVQVFIFELPLNRRDFEVGGNSWLLADELTAIITLAFTKS